MISTTKYICVVAATALLINTGCSSSSTDSTDSTDSNSNTDPAADNANTSDTPAILAIDTNVQTAVGADTNTSFGEPAVDGRGMPFLYQNGFKVDAIIDTSASGHVNTFEFTTNTDNNTITESGNSRSFHEYRYDDVTGRVTEFGALIVSSTSIGGLPNEVFYNNDGTMSGYRLTPVVGTLHPYNKFTYSNGLRQTHIKGREEGSTSQENISNIFSYSPSDSLKDSRSLSSTTGEIMNRGYDYTVNTNGLITSAQRINVNEFDIKFSPEYIFFTYEYDDNNNMVRFQNFTNESELIRTVDITYSRTTEPTPNIAGFMILREGRYTQVFNGYTN